MPTQVERISVLETKVDSLKEDVRELHDCLDKTRDTLTEKLDEMYAASCSQHASLAKELGDVKKFKVYVRNAEGNVVKVNFGHGGTSAKRAGQKTMRIKKSNPARRKSFRARHNCENPGPRTKARYWSCRAW